MEDSKLRKICLLFLIILTLFLTSCGQNTTQLAKDEFSQYYNGKDEVLLNIDGTLHFENYVLDRKDLEPEPYNPLVFYEDLFYYKVANRQYVTIYSCDYYGKNINIFYRKEINSNSNLDVVVYKDSFYFMYRKSRIYYIDKCTISTGVYENIYSGKNCNIYDYVQKEKSKYNVEIIENKSPKEHGKFIITDLETGLSNIIDDEYLRNTIYIESMKKFNYGPKRVDISNGHILLTYGIGAGNGWNFPHLIFEYDFDSNTLEYKLLAFPYDSVPIEIVYIA